MPRFAVHSTAALAAGLMSLTAAQATETVDCQAMDGSEATVEMNLGGGLPIDTPNWVRVTVGDEGWSSLGMDIDSGLTPIGTYQTFDDGRMLMLDLANEDVTEFIIAIRILKAVEGEKIVRAGTLHVIGKSVHPILCDFGDSE